MRPGPVRTRPRTEIIEGRALQPGLSRLATWFDGPEGPRYIHYNRMTVKWPVLALALLLAAAFAADASPRSVSQEPQRPAAQPPAQPESKNFDRLLARAIELHQAGDLFGAIDAYKAALAISPERADALSNLGAAYAKLGQFDDAVKQYDLALKSDPENMQIRMNLALAYYKSARPNEAIPQLKRVLSSDPQARPAYLILADCYLQTGQNQDVVSLLQPRESMFGDDLAYAFILGTALIQSGEADKGETYVAKVFGAGESGESHLLMGMAQLAKQDYPSAKQELERAVQLNPQLPTAHSLYGRALLALGEQQPAEHAFQQELAININDFEANLQLGNLRKGVQRFDEASAYLERAIAIRPKDLTARKLLASLRLQTGKVDEAATMLEAIVKEAPDLVDAHVQLATAYNRLKRPDDAAREKAIVDRLNAEAAAKQKGKGGVVA
jgi:tetratricopeptide (TPR) repeat protein